MSHNVFHTGWEGVKNFLGSEDTSDLRSLISAAGQAGLAYKQADRLEGLGDKANTRLDNLYTEIEDVSKFNPMTVTAGAGTVTFDENGSPTFKRSNEFAGFPKQLADAAKYGYDELYGKTVDPVTGKVTYQPGRNQKGLVDAIRGGQDLEGNFLDTSGNIIEKSAGDFRSQLVKELVGDDTSLTSPFSNVGVREQSLYDRMRDFRKPGEARARSELDQKLQSQGRLGLQTSEYGASPELLSLNQAIEESKSRDIISAMNQARLEAKDLSDARLTGLQEARTAGGTIGDMVNAAVGKDIQGKESGSRILSSTLKDAFAPDEALRLLTNPAIQGSDLANTAGRQLGGVKRDLGTTGLDYDLQTERAAQQTRNQLMSGLFQLLAEGSKGSSSSSSGSSGSNDLTKILGPALEALKNGNVDTVGNPNYDPTDPNTWYGGGAPNWYP